jgi:hypothetical protein
LVISVRNIALNQGVGEVCAERVWQFLNVGTPGQSELAPKGYALYEKFRPEIPPGKKGWGASGKLDLDLIRKLASAWLGGSFAQLS